MEFELRRTGEKQRLKWRCLFAFRRSWESGDAVIDIAGASRSLARAAIIKKEKRQSHAGGGSASHKAFFSLLSYVYQVIWCFSD